jgi:putative transposase
LCAFVDLADFQRAHHQRIEQALENGRALRDNRWSESIAIGSLAFVEKIKSDLGVKAMHRAVVQPDGTYALRELSEPYGREFATENDAPTAANTIPWQKNAETAET